HRDAETGDYPLYAAGNKLFVTKNEGQTWTAISPDLSRNDPSTLGPSGGPITKDNTGVEYYGTIFAAAESPIEAGTIWAGTDDGRLHITRDGGDSWTDITPPRAIFPEWMQVNSIELHPTEAGGLYVAGTRYKLGDFAPYLYRTTDYGATWTKITDGIDGEHFTRVVRADPGRAGLLYAGTESGLYMSVDDGANWQSMQLNLPIVPVTDLAVKEHDLIVATQGRSFWVLDDLTPLHQMTEADTAPMLFAPRPTHRLRGRQASNPSGAGKNAPAGLLLTYRLPATPDSSATTLRVLESDGTVIKSFTATDQSSALPLKPGLNRFTWNLRYPDAEGFDGIVLWAGGLQGPRAAPGAYTARLIVGEDSMDVPVDLRRDPRSSSSDADLAAQFEFLQSINTKLTETHEAVKRIRSAREQINAFVNRIPEGHAGRDTLKTHAAMITDSLTVIEETLYQTKNRSRQDPLNFPIRLNNKLSALVSVASTGDYRPTDQAIAVRDEMIGRIDAQLDALAGLMATEVPAFNALARSYEVPAVIVAGG
ncbi:MAG: glycosyl hydrolase, partial [Bacteroidota bacterium]